MALMTVVLVGAGTAVIFAVIGFLVGVNAYERKGDQ